MEKPVDGSYECATCPPGKTKLNHTDKNCWRCGSTNIKRNENFQQSLEDIFNQRQAGPAEEETGFELVPVNDDTQPVPTLPPNKSWGMSPFIPQHTYVPCTASCGCGAPGCHYLYQNATTLTILQCLYLQSSH